MSKKIYRSDGAKMDEKEFKAIKARIAYELYCERLPKCDTCEHCVFLNGRGKAKRACLLTHDLIDGNVKYCLQSCPKRK